jgi:hypothetical protein
MGRHLSTTNSVTRHSPRSRTPTIGGWVVVSSQKGKELNDLLDIEILSNLRLMTRDTPTTSEKVNHEQTNHHTRTCVYNYVIYMYIYK